MELVRGLRAKGHGGDSDVALCGGPLFGGEWGVGGSDTWRGAFREWVARGTQEWAEGACRSLEAVV